MSFLNQFFSHVSRRNLTIIHASVLSLALAVLAGCMTVPDSSGSPYNHKYYQTLKLLKAKHVGLLNLALTRTDEENKEACTGLLDAFSTNQYMTSRTRYLLRFQLHAAADCKLVQSGRHVATTFALNLRKVQVVTLYDQALLNEKARQTSVLQPKYVKPQVSAVSAGTFFTSL